ncbi:MAG: hypothetical protein E6R03_13790, partial [Hyphomicrobiaceae bacterium]
MASMDDLNRKEAELRASLDKINAFKRKIGGDQSAAQSHRDRMVLRSRENYAASAEIGPLPSVLDPERRERCRLNLMAFLSEYFPETTGLSPFSVDHERVIARMQSSALEGGRYFNLVYRGFAKTTITVNTSLWALLYGHRKSVLMVGATDPSAAEMFEAAQAELFENDLLLGDFPEACFCVRASDGKSLKARYQTLGGKRTGLVWSGDEIVLPSLAGYAGSGGLLRFRSMGGHLRGQGKRVDGRQQRPDWVLVDDAQTDQSARQPEHVTNRLKTLRKSILRLGGHRSTMSCIVNGTVIEPDDFMDQLRNPELNPGWEGETVPMVRRWADAHETFWLSDYARVRQAFDAAVPGDRKRAHMEATALYVSRRAEADAGCEVSWSSCFDPEHEESAIQHAYNILIDDGEEAFASECQQKPLRLVGSGTQLATSDINLKLSGLGWREVPPNAIRLT